MAGVAADVELEGLVDVGRVLGRLSDLDLAELADAAGALLVSSTQRRLHEEKTGPDGDAWAPWSERYDETRLHGVHSLLVSGGHLRDSIASYIDGLTVRVGSNLVYAATHQLGSEDGDIPARPYLGISAEDRVALERMALDMFGEALQ